MSVFEIRVRAKNIEGRRLRVVEAKTLREVPVGQAGDVAIERAVSEIRTSPAFYRWKYVAGAVRGLELRSSVVNVDASTVRFHKMVAR